MYGLPETFKRSFILGRTLELIICFNENTIYFHFDGGLISWKGMILNISDTRLTIKVDQNKYDGLDVIMDDDISS